eukprot:jgi/Hompol1/1804/HPOL_000512-RA
MAKKKGGGKKGKKAKKGGKSKQSKGPKTPKLKGEASPFLTLVIKDESRKYRERLNKAEEEQYARMRAVLAETEEKNAQLTHIEELEAEFQRKLDLNIDPVIVAQMQVIHELESTIQHLEADIEATKVKIAELNEFQQHATDAILEEEISALHEQSDKARLRQLDLMPESSLEEERLNRRLKKQLVRLTEESHKFAEIVKRLEDRNMELVQENVKIDWNFTYLVPDDEPIDEIHAERLYNPELPFEIAALRKSSKSINIPAATPKTRPKSAIPPPSVTFAISSADTPPRIILPPIAIDWRKRYKPYEIRDLDRGIREMVNMEIKQSHLEAQSFGVCGHSFELKSVTAVEQGPARFY